MGLDVVHLIPARHQPFKPDGHGAAADDRMAMLRAAVDGDPLLVADDREIRRRGTSYTIDTVRELAGEYPNDRLSLLVGVDAAREFDDWREAAAIRGLARVVVLTRPGIELPIHSTMARDLIEVPPVPISATEVRRRVAAGETIRELVPPQVAHYIEQRGLYIS